MALIGKDCLLIIMPVWYLYIAVSLKHLDEKQCLKYQTFFGRSFGGKLIFFLNIKIINHSAQ